MRPGQIIIRVSGAEADVAFSNESGGHRWQRVPPTEKYGRVHTSTITVAVLKERSNDVARIKDSDIDLQAFRGSGAGGQARNKTSNAVRLTHKPTKIVVRCESERSQSQNIAIAKSLLSAKLHELMYHETHNAEALSRKTQIGSGMRGDKRRTIRTQDNKVHDHVTGSIWRLSDYLKGDW